MATVFKKTFTKPLPEGAELFTRKGQRSARWKNAKGKTRTAKVTTGKDGKPRIMLEATTYTAKFRNGSGVVREVATGCRDEQAARQVLADLVKRAEHVKAGILTVDQGWVADRATLPIAEHVAAYLEHMKAKTVRGKRVSAAHRTNVERTLNRIIADCGFVRLADIAREAMERWMNQAEGEGMGARTRNTYRAAVVAFCNWCVEANRLTANPLARLCKADERSDRRRVRRALYEGELRRLLIAARLRPLAEYGRETVKLPPEKREGRRTWTKVPLTFDALEAAVARGREALKDQPNLVARLARLGRERALIYKTLTLTGLRKAELASLSVGQLDLDGPRPYAELSAKDEKAGRGARIVLRADLIADLRAHLVEKLEPLQAEARARRKAIPARLPASTPVFEGMPSIRVFDADLAAAGIAKVDDRGRVADLHGLRTTFATHLSKAGVAPRTAQAAMRHSTLDLTMNVYTDPRLLNVAGAVAALPDLPLDDRPQASQGAKTGTDDVPESPRQQPDRPRQLAPTLAPVLAPDGGSRRPRPASADKAAWSARESSQPQVPAKPKERRPKSSRDNGRQTAGEGTRTLNNQLGRLEL